MDNNNLPSNPSPHPTMIENESNKDLSDDEVEMSMISDDYPSSQDGNNTTAGAGAGAGGPPNQLLPSVNIQVMDFVVYRLTNFSRCACISCFINLFISYVCILSLLYFPLQHTLLSIHPSVVIISTSAYIYDYIVVIAVDHFSLI